MASSQARRSPYQLRKRILLGKTTKASRMGPQTEDKDADGAQVVMELVEAVRLSPEGHEGMDKDDWLDEDDGETMMMLRPEPTGDGGKSDEELSPEHHVIRVMGGKAEAGQLQAEEDEGFWLITVQVFFPFLIAGLGMVGAGLVLDIVQHWEVFQKVTELFIMVPALLGLKGNLEMTLASRLSTQANLGHMDTPRQKWSLIKSNLALIQCQAIVVGFLASMAAVIMGWIPEGKFDVYHGMLISASAVLTASIASFVLGVIMVIVIVLSHKYNINPDNVATPIAASLGDLTTLGLLAAIASFLFTAIADKDSGLWWISPCILAAYVALLPWLVYVSRSNPLTRKVLSTGWSPVLAAMCISSMGGVVLDYTVSAYKGIAVFQPVINGVGGNLVAVQASRLSTWLHRRGRPGDLIPGQRVCVHPGATFCTKGSVHAKTARVLLLLVLPGHVIFTLAIYYLQAGHTSLTAVFFLIYLFAAFLQVLLLLYLGHVMILWMWSRAIDPDNSAIPYLTALGDLLGTTFLAMAFHILYLIGDKDADVGD